MTHRKYKLNIPQEKSDHYVGFSSYDKWEGAYKCGVQNLNYNIYIPTRQALNWMSSLGEQHVSGTLLDGNKRAGNALDL